jgi:hypothetical protein
VPGLGQRSCSRSLTIPTAYNILMDFVFAIYPWLIMWKLDMKKSEKLGLCVVMSLVCSLFSAIPRHPIHRTYINTCNRVWSSQSQRRSEHTGSTKATPKTNCTSGASVCRPSGTPPKLQALSLCNVSQCCGRWSAMFVRRFVQRNRQGDWRPRMTLSWMEGWSNNGIMRSKGSWRVGH